MSLIKPGRNKAPSFSRRTFLHGTAGVALAGALPSFSGCAPEEVFTLVSLPDTQNYSDLYPEVYMAQTRWIAEHKDSDRIEFVTHLGDIVDNGPDLRQWGNAHRAMKVLDDAGVRYGTSLGNHDLMYANKAYAWPTGVDQSCSYKGDLDCAAKDYLTHFGPGLYKGRPWYGGASPSGLSNYQTFTIAEVKLLFLHLSVDPRQAEVAWAQTVLDRHQDHLVHLSTHRYMYDYRLVKTLPSPLNKFGGGRFDAVIHSMGQQPYFKDSSTADDFFKNFVFKNTNIFMVQCGHVDAELRQVSTNAAAQPVHEMLVDFQTFEAKGGNGWMRLLEFNLDLGEVHVRTYSPYLKRFRSHEDAFNGCIKAFEMVLKDYSQYLMAFSISEKEMRQKLAYWSKDPAGRKEFHELLFADGRRDSDFVLKVDFGAYT